MGFKFLQGPVFRSISTEEDCIVRHFSESGKIAWFDELLDSSMGVIRGSGIAVLENGEWKIQHYVLSYTIPNELAKEVTELKRN
ncbi:MAG TPA: nuclear transport factor 2 family protein [Salinimicrobium sp.]|nr:nuclear transport factor 2 family protein [Salinimicrobium sp.]